MGEALWVEIQNRYGFEAPYPIDHSQFDGPRGGFWVALEQGRPVGSIALSPFDEMRGELDVMFVVADHRRRGIAEALLVTLEDHARRQGFSEILLRAGEPQPEAMAFYKRNGFCPIEPFGHWVNDETARCLRKPLTD